MNNIELWTGFNKLQSEKTWYSDLWSLWSAKVEIFLKEYFLAVS